MPRFDSGEIASVPSLLSLEHICTIDRSRIYNNHQFAMSKKSDLLVRVRYLNPLPNPPFPPKLLNVNTNISRLGEPAYLDQLAATTPLPMLVDSEMGMPLDLNVYDGAWDGKDQCAL